MIAHNIGQESFTLVASCDLCGRDGMYDPFVHRGPIDTGGEVQALVTRNSRVVGGKAHGGLAFVRTAGLPLVASVPPAKADRGGLGS